MENDRRLLKFKLKDDDVFVKYERPSDSAAVPDTVTLESGEAPRVELREAMKALREDIIEMTELPIDEAGLKVIGITYTHGDYQGVVITALRELDNSNSPLVLNTPHFTSGNDNDSDMNVYSMECAERLDALEELVFAYVDGDRQQQELEFEDAEPELVLG